MLRAPGMCPPRWQVSGSPGGARISPLNSGGLRTSTRATALAETVAFVVGLGVYVDFHDSDLGIGEMLRDPIGRNQCFRMCVICHLFVLLTLLLYSTCYIGFLTPMRRGPKSHNYRVKSVRRGGPGA